jgi:hypothetical protein
LLALYDTAGRVVADAQAIHIPTQLLISGADWVVHKKPQHKFFDRLGSVTKEKHVFPGFYHDTFGEKERHLAIAKARDFIERQFAQPILPPNLLNEHLQGFTKNEADAIAAPLPWWSPRAWLWGLTRGSIRLGAHLSSGLRLGHETGFDSGSTLDCVYRNHPEGRTALGRYIDRSYLNSIGWRGIRQRKTHVEELLRTAMKSLAARGEPIHVLDIAAGHGRYVLDALTGGTIRPNSILLRDYSDINVREGDALIEQRGLGSVARFEKGDAFDRDAIANLNPRPTVAIVSGLYELFADNGMVGRSLAGIAAASPPGAYLIYTGQPWHPQLEFIGRALTSHRAGAAWVMRRRTQAELDQLVEVAGFRKIEQRIDEWGIFTVSLAERTGS